VRDAAVNTNIAARMATKETSDAVEWTVLVAESVALGSKGKTAASDTPSAQTPTRPRAVRHLPDDWGVDPRPMHKAAEPSPNAAKAKVCIHPWGPVT
jgi:hypothetical protein